MLYNGWYGCGLTTVVLTVSIGGNSSDDEKESEVEK
jgi:hypothetical protein